MFNVVFVLLLAILISLLLSAFFSGSEIAFISASKLELELKKDKFTKKGHIISKFYEKTDRFLSTMLIGNNIALVAFTYFMTKLLEPWFISYLGHGITHLLIVTIIITVIVLVFGEFLPKMLFSLYAHKALYWFTYPLLLFSKILYLPSSFTTYFSSSILKSFNQTPRTQEASGLGKIDLEHFIEDAIEEEGEEIDKTLFSNALRLDQMKVRDCMVPRKEIVFVDINASISEAIDIFKESNHSRLIVIDHDIESIRGYIHHQQLLEKPRKIPSILLDINFIPEIMNVRDLMSSFIKKQTNIVCVVDEYGSLSGIITLEDILEEIFGEIEDEHDADELLEIVISENEFLFSGRLEIDQLNDKFPNLNIPEGEYNTLSGYIVMTLGRIPIEGERIEMKNFLFIIEKVADTHIEQIRVHNHIEQPPGNQRVNME